MTPTRPLLRWHGGKWRLAPQIIAHFPAHRTYVEPYSGAGSVLLRKPRAYAEVLNDLDGEVVNLFRVLRGPDADALIDALRLTPFARAEFEGAYTETDDHVERARHLVIRSFMGFGSNAHAGKLRGHRSTGFRCNTRSGTTPATDWAGYPEHLPAIVERLRGVVIENRPALAVMAKHDGPDTLHYVDPPYMRETRSAMRHKTERNAIYAHEMSDGDHEDLLAALVGLRGMVVLSGYSSPLYDEALRSWRRIEIAAMADGAKPRTEVLWINPAAVDQEAGLFAPAAE